MSGPAPLLPFTTTDGGKVRIHIARIIKITPSHSESQNDSGRETERRSTFTVATGTGTADIEISEFLLNRGSAALVRFLLLTDLHGLPILINPAYVILARENPPSGTVLEIYSGTGTEDVYVRESLDTLTDWWASSADAHLVG